MRHPRLWHFSFGGPHAERLVAGRERIYLDRFWNEFAGDPAKIDEATRAHDAKLYARPGAMRVAFAQLPAFPTDVADNQAAMATKPPMPVLAIGGERSFGAIQAAVYITPVERPARMACGIARAATELSPSDRRATVMQASLAIAGFVCAVVAWLTGGAAWCVVGGFLLASVLPFTLLVIMPTNKALLDCPREGCLRPDAHAGRGVTHGSDPHHGSSAVGP